MAVADSRPLAIIQARLHSTRLPNKMLQSLGGETLVARSFRIACEAFGPEHVVAAIPKSDESGPLGEELRRIGAAIFACDHDENDVVWRMYMAYIDWTVRTNDRHSPLIVRITPDDPWKTPAALHRTVEGHVQPIEIGGEAFSFGELLAAQMNVKGEREHVTYAIRDARRAIGHVPIVHPPCPPGCWTIDTPEQLDAARAKLAEMEG